MQSALFRRADERQFGAPTADQVHAGRLQADRSSPAAAQGPVRRVARAHHLLRLLGSRLAVRPPKSTGDERDPAATGGAGRAGSTEGLGEERPRPCDPELHERARASSSSGSATTRSIRWSRRRRCRSWLAPASRRARRQGRTSGLGRWAGSGRRPTTTRQRRCESSIRITANAGSSRRRTERSPPSAARRASRSRPVCRSRATIG